MANQQNAEIEALLDHAKTLREAFRTQLAICDNWRRICETDSQDTHARREWTDATENLDQILEMQRETSKAILRLLDKTE